MRESSQFDNFIDKLKRALLPYSKNDTMPVVGRSLEVLKTVNYAEKRVFNLDFNKVFSPSLSFYQNVLFFFLPDTKRTKRAIKLVPYFPSASTSRF